MPQSITATGETREELAEQRAEYRRVLRLARITLAAKGGCTAAERNAAITAIDAVLA